MEGKLTKPIQIDIAVRNDMPDPDNNGAALFSNEKAYDCVMKALKTNEEGRRCECIKELIMQFETWKEEYKLLKEAENSDLAELKK